MNTSASSFVRLGLLALLVALGQSSALAQGVWKWRDKDGRIQISDRPPPNEVLDKDIIARPAGAKLPPAALTPEAAASEAAVQSAPRGDPALEAKKKQAQAEQAAADKAKKDADTAKRNQARAETCQRARNQLAALEGGQRVARMNEKGEREFLDDNARNAEATRTRQVADANCD